MLDMPELPEVQTVVDEMHSRVTGDTIVAAVLSRADYVRTPTPDFAERIQRRRILSVSREGKRIWLDLSAPGGRTRKAGSDARCRLHLGMSGRITFEAADAPLAPHTHLRLRFRRLAAELRFSDARRFGGIWFYNGSDGDAMRAARLGADALTLSAGTLQELCRRKRPIKSLLMDQSLIGGLGNIYCDEALFSARLHPLRRACELSDADIRRLAGSIRDVLRRALRHGGSTLRDYVRADGRAGEFQRLHRVYGREGHACARCRRQIERIVIAGRSTHFCPQCQNG